MRRLRRNGETNPVTVIVIILLVGAGFYGYHVGPVYMDNLTVKEYAAEAFNIYWNDNENVARDRLLIKLNTMPVTHYEVDENGTEVIKPGLGCTEDNVSFKLDETGRKLTVRVEYDRIIEFSPLKKRKKFHVIAEKTGTQAK